MIDGLWAKRTDGSERGRFTLCHLTVARVRIDPSGTSAHPVWHCHGAEMLSESAHETIGKIRSTLLLEWAARLRGLVPSAQQKRTELVLKA